MSGAVGVICQDTARYSMFHIALKNLRTPPNTGIEYALTSDRILGRNKLAEMAVEEGREWLLFLDDDHTFPDDLLMRLLKHNVNVVGSLYLQRMKPFLPVAYATKDEDGMYWPINLHAHKGDELVTGAAVGTGGMLIRTEVFRAIPKPWFEHGRVSEDLVFCDAVIEAGLGPIHIDLGCRMGHLSPSAMHAHYDEESGWEVAWALADGFSATVEMPVVEKPEVSDEAS